MRNAVRAVGISVHRQDSNNLLKGQGYGFSVCSIQNCLQSKALFIEHILIKSVNWDSIVFSVSNNYLKCHCSKYLI